VLSFRALSVLIPGYTFLVLIGAFGWNIHADYAQHRNTSPPLHRLAERAEEAEAAAANKEQPLCRVSRNRFLRWLDTHEDVRHKLMDLQMQVRCCW
jgi:hypothetical protein